MLNKTPDAETPRWTTTKAIVVAITVGTLGMAGLLSLRACRPPENERPQTSQAQSGH